ncbi:MAG: hypothetical protein QXV69_03825 [Sulfolobaceae archaeon]
MLVQRFNYSLILILLLIIFTILSIFYSPLFLLPTLGISLALIFNGEKGLIPISLILSLILFLNESIFYTYALIIILIFFIYILFRNIRLLFLYKYS